MKNSVAYIISILLFLWAQGIQDLQAQNRAVSVHFSSTESNIEGDIITKTIRVPEGFTPTYTYYSAMGWWGTGGEGDGYCGIQQHPNGRNFIFSIWDPESTSEPIVASYLGHGTLSENFGGEGTGLKSWNFSLGWDTDTWYRMVTRLWDEGAHTMFGYWVQDMTTRQWYHLVTMDYPVEGVRINSGINSFLEDWYGNGWEARRYMIRDSYKRRLDGSWLSHERNRFSVNQEAPTANYNDNFDGGILGDSCFFIASGGETEPSCLPTAIFTLPQDPAPQWEPIVLQQLDAGFDAVEKRLYVSWETDPGAGPQLSYHGAIYNTPGGEGVPALSFNDTVPQCTGDTLDITSLANGRWYLRLYVTDIFDGRSDEIEREFVIDMEVKKPVALFEAKATTVSRYSFVEFRENSGGIPASWEWQFEGAEPATSSERHPVVSYSTPGAYDVTLIVSNSEGKDTLLKEDYITVEPVADNALDLRGVMGDYVVIPDLELATQEMTFECWMKIPEDQQGYAGIFFNRDQKASGLNFRDRNELGYHWNDRSYSWSSGLYVPLNRWTHVAWVVSATGVAIYMDGVPAFHRNTVDQVDFSAPWKLGADYPFGRNFNGLIDEVRIWNRVRTAGEILDNRYLELDYENEPDLWAYYRCDQQETDGLYDLLGDRHAAFESLDPDSWQPSFEKTNSPVAPVAAFASSLTVAEVGTDIEFYDASAYIPVSWSWYFQGGTPAESSERFPVVRYASPGIFDVKLVIANQEGSDSIVKEGVITIVNPPPPEAIFSANRVVIERGGSITMNNMSKNEPTEFHWYFEGGTPDYSTEFEPVVQYQDAGTFDIRLEISNAYGADTLELDDYIRVTYPAAVEGFENGVKVEALEDQLVIHRIAHDDAFLVMTNTTGQVVCRVPLAKGRNLVRPGVGEGIYLVVVRDGNELIRSKFYFNK
ncbi:MAG: LamG-like jellyroll fold domain-containing protein [Bacteroidota bacterium]